MSAGKGNDLAILQVTRNVTVRDNFDLPAPPPPHLQKEHDKERDRDLPDVYLRLFVPSFFIRIEAWLVPAAVGPLRDFYYYRMVMKSAPSPLRMLSKSTSLLTRAASASS